MPTMNRLLIPGEPLPWFHGAALDGNPRYALHTAAGRWFVLLLMGTGTAAPCGAALDLLQAHRDLFDDERASFFGVTIDQGDADEERIAQRLPGIRWLLDYDRSISTLLGACREEEDGRHRYRPHWLLVDPLMRVHQVADLAEGGALFERLRAMKGQPAPEAAAPVLVVPNVFDRDLCRRLIALHDQTGGEDSGFMREENGITMLRVDHNHKRRRDQMIEDQAMVDLLKARINIALRPMIQRAFQFDATRIERFLVACYDAREGSHFRPHRDNTTKGTAHRRFACTINLNEEAFDGGELCFPEFGQRRYRAPTGGAIVFSCSLLHEALPVTRGRRYAFLPFFYDEDAARLRERNIGFVTPEVAGYRSGLESQSEETASL
jgi:predicted 2-oxoglutarate/Fe(II)-dependent dioxygenase YbiX/peroxiredoxin